MMENGLDIFMPQNNAATSVLTRLIRAFCSPMMESRRDQIRKEILLESKKNKRLALSEIMKTIHDGMAKGSLSTEQFNALYTLYNNVLLTPAYMF